jgi:hypothetical protein
MTVVSYNDRTAFTNEIMNIEVDTLKPIKIIKPGKSSKRQECFDVGLVLYQGKKLNKIIILIELKSLNVLKGDYYESKETFAGLLPANSNNLEGQQFLNLVKAICELKDDHDTVIKQFGTSNLTIKGNNSMTNKKFQDVVQYIYATTLEQNLPMSKWGAIKLVRNDLKSFFSSPFWEIYEAIMSMN